MNNLVINNNGQPVTNSLLVAEKFRKRHSDVMKVIRNLLTTAQNCAVLSMLIESAYINEQGKEQPMYIMNRDGFTLLVMGFTGKDALNFKLDYINAFNQMEAQLKVAQPKHLTQSEMLLQSVQLIVEQEKRVNHLENKVNEIDARTTTRMDYFTVAGYCRLNGFKASSQMCITLGKRASKLSKERGWPIDEVPDTRWGKVGSYPKHILDEIFNQPL